MARSLRDLELVNRWWGGARALDRWLLARVAEARGPGPFRAVDVGAGSGGVARRVARRLSAAGHRATVVATDLQWRHLAAGRAFHTARIPGVAADGFRLPFRDGGVDWAFSTLLFHHFSPEANAAFLRELARVSLRGFAVLDLRRHLIPWIFVSVAGRLVFQSRVSVSDGQTSVFQAYTHSEAASIARGAVPGALVKTVFPYRLLITGPGG